MELLQVRVDKRTKERAAAVFESMGLDLSTAVRVFLRKAILVGGIPFEVTNSDKITVNAIMALEEMRDISEANGNCNMTLEEINEEIAAARRERKRKDK